MRSGGDVYSPREIARAAGVAERDVRAVLGAARELIPHDEAVRVGRLLVQQLRPAANRAPSGVAPFAVRIPQIRSVPLAVSSALHVAAVGVAVFATFNLEPHAAALVSDTRPAEPMRLVFLATPGPGGGGGGGGLQQHTPPPKQTIEGTHKISSPIRRIEPKLVAPTPPPPKPDPPLAAEQLPAVVAPIVTAPADARTRAGVLAQTAADTDSHGPGTGGGTGTGRGGGIGEGDGNGIGPGSGGGTGGGPFRPGSGIEPPRLLREVKADYTEEARQRGLSGEVVLEIVVRRDGSVGDVRLLQGLGAGLNERATQAVRQWRFAPAVRQGTPVDVVVEVAVEFRLR